MSTISYRRLKRFHRIAGWFGFHFAYECRFVPAGTTRNVTGRLEWETEDVNEAIQRWEMTQQAKRSQHGKFHLEIRRIHDFCTPERSEKKQSRHQSSIPFKLPSEVSGEAPGARAKPNRQETQTHETSRDSSDRADHRQPTGTDPASRAGESMAIGSARREAEAKASQASRHAGGIADIGDFKH